MTLTTPTTQATQAHPESLDVSQGDTLRSGWFKCMRNPEVMELIEKHPPSFLLLFVIAYRANRHSGFNRHGLKSGEAYVGDVRRCGLTEQNYRTAKQILTEGAFATFRPTNKGTVATLMNTRVFDINIGGGNEPANERVTDSQRAANGQVTTNKEVKKGRTEEGKKVRTAFIKPTLEEVILYGLFRKEDFGSRRVPRLVGVKRLEKLERLESSFPYVAQKCSQVRSVSKSKHQRQKPKHIKCKQNQ